MNDIADARCSALDPDTRDLYSALLKPPAGTVFDSAVATTFSLDFETALSIPVALTLFAGENREEMLESRLTLLEGLAQLAQNRQRTSTEPKS